MKLFGSYTSPYVRHCRIVLLETGLDCEFVEADGKVSNARSATKRVPFLEDGDLLLTDSSSIVRYLREKSGGSFLPDVLSYDRYCLVNTALDSEVNLFVLERDGIMPDQSAYLTRQRARIGTCLEALESWVQSAEAQSSAAPAKDDVALRLACFLDWSQFRNRLSLAPFPRLTGLLERARSYAPFAETAPRL